MAARKPLNENVTSAVSTSMAYLEIAVPVNQINVSPDGKFINLPWGAAGTFTHGSKVVEAKIGRAGKVVILTKAARKQATKSDKPAVDLSKVL
jgi:hypothetical protein